MVKFLFAVGIISTQSRAPHAAVNQVEKLRLGSINKLAAWLGHGLSLADIDRTSKSDCAEIGLGFI